MHADLELATRIRNGDERAFEELLDRYGDAIHRLSRRYTRSLGDSEDLTQTIFCDIFRSIGGYRGKASLQTWVFRVALNHCLKARNKLTLQTVLLNEDLDGLPQGGGDPLASAVRGELGEQVREALGSLSSAHYDVVVLCELQGFTYQECAAALHIPVGTVKSRLSNAFKRLRGALKDYIMEATPSICAEPVGECVR